MLLLDNREVRKGWESLKAAVAGIFGKHGAEVLSSRRWDERRLGYPVKTQLRGTYLLLYFKSDTQALTAIRRDLQFAESVLRFLTMQCDDVPETAYEPEAEFDVTAIPDENAAPASEIAAADAAAASAAAGEAAAGEAAAGEKSEDAPVADGEEAPAAAGDAASEGSTEGDAPAAEGSEPEAKTEA